MQRQWRGGKRGIMFSQIDGVLIFPVLSIPDERGCVWKTEDPTFLVKDVYITVVRYGAIKAWHGYETKRIFYTTISGVVKLVLFDMRKNSLTNGVFDELFLGKDSRFSVEIPPGVYAGFKGISQEDAITVVQASEKYQQIYRIPYDELPYDWNIKNG